MTKKEVIDRLKKSDSFLNTQSIIGEFPDLSTLNQADKDECIDIAISNSQVLGKLKYKDGNIVREFFEICCKLIMESLGTLLKELRKWCT